MSTKVELAQELIWRRCAKDPVYFFERYWKIQHPELGAIPFELFDAQTRALEKFMVERYVITLKARQIGWTTLVAAYAFWHAFFYPDRPIVFLSKGEREAAKILAKVTYGYKRMPEWMRARGPRPTRDNMTTIEFDNGSAIESLPSKSDPARGGSYYLVVVDEWGFLENGEEAWASIEPIADVGGRVIGLSTANGIGNYFYEAWCEAEAGTNRFVPIFEPWSARSDRDEAWYESKRKSMKEWQLHQEYPRTPEEAFIKSGNPFFDTDRLMGMVCEPGVRGEIIFDDLNLERVMQKHADGQLEVWKFPAPGDKYVLGADVAEGLEWGDFSSAHVKRLRTGEVVAHWHGHVPPDEFGARVLNDLGRYYNNALVGVENNNHGLTTCTALKGAKYPNIFYTRIVDERTKRETRKIGWTTSRRTRPIMLDDLSTALRDDSITLHCAATVRELRTFVRDEHARLHGSPFDDRTMSLAITEQMAAYAHQYDYVDEGALEWGMLAWWEQQIDERDAAAERAPIGSHNVRPKN